MPDRTEGLRRCVDFPGKRQINHKEYRALAVSFYLPARHHHFSHFPLLRFCVVAK
jgi:hypothetical protein